MPDVVTVLGSGWSASLLDLAKLPGHVIGINDALLHAPRLDEVVTMDRRWLESRWSVAQRKQLPLYARWAALKSVTDLPSWCHGFICEHTTAKFAERTGFLNGTNSGGCGFNRAYQLRPRRIYLVGFDMRPGPRGESHWHPAYPWHSKVKATWAAQFADNAEQCRRRGIEVRLVGEWSVIGCFARVSAAAIGCAREREQA